MHLGADLEEEDQLVDRVAPLEERPVDEVRAPPVVGELGQGGTRQPALSGSAVLIVAMAAAPFAVMPAIELRRTAPSA